MRADVRVTGDEALHRNLVDIGHHAQDALDRAAEEVASDTARAARSTAAALGSTAAKSAPAVRTDGRLMFLEGDRYPFAAGAELGSDLYAQFKPRNGGESGGYFMGPAIREAEDGEPEYLQALDRLLDQRGPA